MKRRSFIILAILFAFNGVADDTLVNPKAELIGVIDSVRRRIAMLNVADKPTLPSTVTYDPTLLTSSLLRDIVHGESLILMDAPSPSSPPGFQYDGFGEDKDVRTYCRGNRLYPYPNTTFPRVFGAQSTVQLMDYPFNTFCTPTPTPKFLNNLKYGSVLGVDKDPLVRMTTDLHYLINSKKPEESHDWCLGSFHDSNYKHLYPIDDILAFRAVNTNYAQALWYESGGVPHSCIERTFTHTSKAYCKAEIEGKSIYITVSAVTNTCTTNIVGKYADSISVLDYENKAVETWVPGTGTMTIRPNKGEQEWYPTGKQEWYEPYEHYDPRTRAIGHGIKYEELAWTSGVFTVVAYLAFSSCSYEDFANTQGYIDSYYSEMSPIISAFGESKMQVVVTQMNSDGLTPYWSWGWENIFNPSTCPLEITNYFGASSISRLGQRHDCKWHFMPSFNGSPFVRETFANYYPKIGQQFIRYKYGDIEFDEYVSAPFYFTNDVEQAEMLTSCDINFSLELAPDPSPAQTPWASGEAIKGKLFTFLRFKPKEEE